LEIYIKEEPTPVKMRPANNIIITVSPITVIDEKTSPLQSEQFEGLDVEATLPILTSNATYNSSPKKERIPICDRVEMAEVINLMNDQELEILERSLRLEIKQRILECTDDLRIFQCDCFFAPGVVAVTLLDNTVALNSRNFNDMRGVTVERSFFSQHFLPFYRTNLLTFSEGN
jgi:hypothetical protein